MSDANDKIKPWNGELPDKEGSEFLESKQSHCSNMSPVRLAVVGAGGFASVIIDRVLRAEDQCQPTVKLVAVAEPDSITHELRLAELRQRGIATVPDMNDLLADPCIEAVWLPLPIPLHRSFTERALAAGKAVLVEKPAAGSVQDVDAMISARNRSGLPVAVGFQHISDPLTKKLKQQLISGQIGTLRHAVVHACWSRSQEYFQRSAWAGRLKQNNSWVMDSPANNALAHFLNLALFLLGPILPSSACVERVEAELYRAHEIENFDTISLRAHLVGGATLLVLLTHACRDVSGPTLRVEGTNGQLVYTSLGASLDIADSHEQIAASADLGTEIVECFARLVRGIPDPTRLVSTLETARAQVLLVNAASEATAVIPVPPTHIEHFKNQDENGIAIIGIEEAIRHCAEHHQMLHESGLLSFTRPAGTLDVHEYRQFAGPKQA